MTDQLLSQRFESIAGAAASLADSRGETEVCDFLLMHDNLIEQGHQAQDILTRNRIEDQRQDLEQENPTLFLAAMAIRQEIVRTLRGYIPQQPGSLPKQTK